MPDSELEEAIVDSRRAIEEGMRFFREAPDKSESPTGPWGPKEAVSHLLWWHIFTLQSTEAVLAGRQADLPPGDREDINANAAIAYSLTPIAELADQMVMVHDRVVAAMRELRDPSVVVMRRADGTAFSAPQRLRAVADHVRQHVAELEDQRN